jgi:hypothetical protein
MTKIQTNFSDFKEGNISEKDLWILLCFVEVRARPTWSLALKSGSEPAVEMSLNQSTESFSTRNSVIVAQVAQEGDMSVLVGAHKCLSPSGA